MATSPHALPGIALASTGQAGLTWPAAIAATAIAMAWVVVCLLGTATAMAGIWARSDTFMHGMLIAPISLWLAYRMREQLMPLVPRPSYPALVLVAAAGLAWSIGELAAVDALAQFALVAMVALAVPSLMGWAVARALMFPLGFLFFMVPFGEFLLPPLMAGTADVTVAAVRASGVPVYQEGLQFILPSGRWSVVEACSGVRYLIASVVAGSLYAYLNYRSARRRAIFVGVSILVPIVANWIRAYLIVMLGHLSNNTIAVGVDHLIYGWLFFGVVLMLLFWAGTFWREDTDEPVRAPAAAAGPRTHEFAWALPALVAFALAVAVWPVATRGLAAKSDAGNATLAAVEAPAAWTATPGGLTEWAPRFVGTSASSHATYARGTDKVALYIAYYRNQGDGRKVVSSENVLAASEDEVWTVGDTAIVKPALAQAPAEVREAIVKRADGSRLVTWRWYWIDGKTTASDATAKLLGLRMRVAGRGDDGAIVVASAQADSVAAARRILASFVDEANPALERALVRTRGER